MKVSEFSRPVLQLGQSRPNVPAGEQAGAKSGFYRKQVYRTLEGMTDGELRIREAWGEEDMVFGTPGADGLKAEIVVNTPSVFADVMLRGSIGAAEAYMRGEWTTPDLVSVTRVFARNIDVTDSMEGGATRFVMALLRLGHAFKRNTVDGSRKNISAHYDLSNEFFALFLDPTMMYSSAIFASPEQGLDDAAVNKLDRLCRKLDLRDDVHLLEIGTGWGGLAIHAATRYGCRVTTTTISQEQYAHAVEMVKKAGLQDRVTVLKQDYRELEGKFDRLVSVEMIEAVGAQYIGTYFEKCASLLKPDGLMAIQAITMAEHRCESARRNVDFIQKYIFPGGFLPSLAEMSGEAARRTTLQPVHVENLPLHYARTLEIWRERFLSRQDAVRALGFDSVFIRMWEYYLAYCEAGFREGATGLLQIVLAGPRATIDASHIDLFDGHCAKSL